MRAVPHAVPAIVGLALLAACEADPPGGDGAVPAAVETGFVGGDGLPLWRDDLRPTGWYRDADGHALQAVGARLRDGVRSFPASLEWRWSTGDQDTYAFFLDPGVLSIPLDPGRVADLELVLLPPLDGVPERVVARATYGLHPGVIVIPVATWNILGRVPGVSTREMQYLLDRADDLHPPDGIGPGSWAWQRVDSVWAPCGIQFRFVGHQDAELPGACWRAPVVSNQSALVPRCSTLRAECTPGSAVLQDFGDCGQQEQNLCSLLDLVRVAAEEPGWAGPAIHRPGAVNVYFAEAFHLYENLTAGIGCSGDYPLVALSDLWSDPDGLRLAHELGHAMGITHHVSGTVMGDEEDRTDWLGDDLCWQARLRVASRPEFGQ